MPGPDVSTDLHLLCPKGRGMDVPNLFPAWCKAFRQVGLAVWLACAGQACVAADPPDGLVALSFEELLETDVSGAASFVREVTDAPSAVSVVTAEEIQQFGYRTLAEILNSMRGVHVSFDGAYHNLSGRGYGNALESAGRIALLVDGYPVADPMHYQIFMGDESLLDPSIIDRVEYAPGPGAAVYGNNAFLGVFNVITRKGRDLDGARLARLHGSHGDRKTRLNFGKRLDSSTDILLSLSTHAVSLPDHMRVDDLTAPRSEDERFFLKVRHRGWWLETARAKRDQQHVAEFRTWSGQDLSTFTQVGYDAEWDGLKASFKLYDGSFAFHNEEKGKEGAPDAERRLTRAASGAHAQLAGTVSDWRRWTLGAEYRKERDIGLQQRVNFGPVVLFSQTLHGDDVRFWSIYAQEEVHLHPDVDVNLGLRYDQRQLSGQYNDVLNPRLGLVYRLTPDTQFKLAHGRAARWMGWMDRNMGFDTVERVRTTEASAESRWPRQGLRLLGSLYSYRIDPRKETVLNPTMTYIASRGAEVELEWRWQGVFLRASHAVQTSRDNLGEPLKNVPSRVSKLQVSVPLANDRWRVSLALRALARRDGDNNPGAGAIAKSYAATDVTLLGRNLVKGLDLTFAVRDLFDKQSGVESRFSNKGQALPWGGRTYWLQLEYKFL
ncbi:TonB-dependent receptor plug domain-containing protein [Hydrogenophaga aquatica]